MLITKINTLIECIHFNHQSKISYVQDTPFLKFFKGNQGNQKNEK